MEKIHYISIGYFSKLYKGNYAFDQDLCDKIKEYLNFHYSDDSDCLFFIDFEKVSFLPAQSIDIKQPKKTSLYFSFIEFFQRKKDSVFIFINCDSFIGSYITQRDFQEISSIWVTGTKEDYYIKSTANSSDETLITCSDFVEKHLKLKKIQI